LIVEIGLTLLIIIIAALAILSMGIKKGKSV
jgi:hypothetical protein